MIRQVAGGLAALGLVGGAGAVTYNHNGTATVTVTDKQGHKELVTLGGGNGKLFDCPASANDKLAPVDLRAGRIKITLRHVRRDIRRIVKRYPNHTAPGRVVDRVNVLIKREPRLVHAFNAAIDRHNAIIDADCTAR